MLGFRCGVVRRSTGGSSFDGFRVKGVGVTFFRCWDILGLLGTLGGLPRRAGLGVGFWDVGLGVLIVMIESRHRSWEGGGVSGQGLFIVVVGSLRRRVRGNSAGGDGS